MPSLSYPISTSRHSGHYCIPSSLIAAMDVPVLHWVHQGSTLVPPQYHSGVHFLAGGVAEFCSSILFVPFDVVRSRLQLGCNPNRATGGLVPDTRNYPSISAALSSIWRKEVQCVWHCMRHVWLAFTPVLAPLLGLLCPWPTPTHRFAGVPRLVFRLALIPGSRLRVLSNAVCGI